MKKRIIILLLTGLLLSVTKTHSQGKFGHVSPQTADFIRHGEIPVSTFTGQMKLEIPIYRIQDQDFDVPISLLYTSDGFKTEKRSDWVGLDWTLIGAGCISREVYGAPDESRANSVYGQEMGYLFAAENSGTYNPTNIWNFAQPAVLSVTGSNGYYYVKPYNGFFVDYQPDLFLFNFNGHSGQFMIDGYGTARANNKGYKVDISGLTKQSTYETLLPETSTIRITAPNGYIYEFGGGTLDAMEFSVSFTDGIQWSNGIDGSSTQPVILAWHLSKITAPNGRSMKFYYESIPLLGSHSISLSSPLWQSEKGEGMVPQSGKAIKKAVLKSIEVDGTNKVKIEFIKSKEKTLETTDSYNDRFFTGHDNFNRAIHQLDSVYVKYNGTLCYKYALTYTNRNKRRFLSSVIQTDGAKYEFEYNHPSAYPSPSINYQTDAYGYWKGNNTNNSYGLLSHVYYPTGGHSSFTYEAHQYAQAIELNLSTLITNLVNVSSMTDTLHGARIKKISHYDSNSETVKRAEKEYIYSNSISGTGSSGILYQTRPYAVHQSGAKVYVTDYSHTKYYNIGEYPVGYSFVFEKNMDDSYSRYKFSDWNNNSDSYEVKRQYCNTNATPDNAPLLLAFVNRITSRSDKRGLLIEKYIYDSNSNEKAKERYLYDGVYSPILIPNDFYSDTESQSSEFIVFGSIPGGGMAKKVQLSYHPLLYKEETIDNVVRKEKYGYNSYGLLKKKSLITGTSDSIQTHYTYPVNYSTGIYPEMATKNQIDFVVEETGSVVRGSNRQETQRIKRDYMKDNVRTKGLILPDKLSSSSSGGSFWTTCTYDLYDDKGRCLQYTQDGITWVYLWSYNHQYPVAEFQNATYAQVETALGQTAANRIANADALSASDAALLNNLRTNTNLSNAMITTCQYKPLVGITEMIDPRGVKTTYQYDTFGRLQTVKDHNGNMIEKYDYHYKNQ
jgi:YD repeat-containing protein